MGFRIGAYAKVWEVKSVSDKCTQIRISISRKDKETNQYETEFSGYVRLLGAVTAKEGLQIKEGDTIKLGDVDVRTKYDKEKRITYTNYMAFSFERADGSGSGGGGSTKPKEADGSNNEPADPIDDRELPF